MAMSEHNEYLQVRCPVCSWSALCDLRDMMQRLRQARMLRREGQPDAELVLELFRAAGEKLACDGCSATGLFVELPDQEALDWSDADWNDADWNDADGGPTRRCEVCGQTIPAERIELFPDALRCAKCQASQEKGQTDEEPEYCPKCGSVMTLRASARDGITRYQLRCESCGR